MKMKVLDVVTMAGNDHRVSLENDEVKIDIQFKSYKAFSHVNFKQGDEIENPFESASGAAIKPPKTPKVKTLKVTTEKVKAPKVKIPAQKDPAQP